MEKHQGEELRNYLKGKGLEMQDVAERLGMSRQNLSYHLRKQYLDGDFMRLVSEKMQIDFPLVKEESEGNNKDVSMSIPSDPFVFLIKRTIKIEAQNEVILQQLAAWIARDSEEGLTVKDVVSKLSKEVEDKIRSLMNKLR